MVDQRYQLSGQISDRTAKEGIHGLRVEAWDKTNRFDDPVGVGITDRRGRFHISLDERYAKEVEGGRPADVFFQVFSSDRTLITSTEESVVWNPVTEKEIALEIARPAPEPIRKDRITVRQVRKGVNFFEKSDFRGLRKEVGDRTGTAFNFVKDMLGNTFSKLDIEPIKVDNHRNTDVIHRNVGSARRNLEAQGIKVHEVKPYKPGINIESFTNLTAFPTRLKEGQTVNLYEEKGRVRYYSVVEGQQSTGGEGNGLVVQELTKELENIKKELATTKEQSVQKDQQITALQQEMNVLRESQITPEKIIRIEEKIALLEASTQKAAGGRSTKTRTPSASSKKTGRSTLQK